MLRRREKEIVRVALVSVITATLMPGCGIAQVPANDTLPGALRVDTLGLPQAKGAALQQALNDHDYVKAEGILLAEIQAAQKSSYKDRLLQVVGGVYFLNHDDLNAAIAWQKAESIAPLPAQLQFSLAMVYIRMGRRDWARKKLQTLAAEDAKAALYPYWLGRIDYDDHAYEDAITQFQKAIQLKPEMGRAYDNLGLCFFYRNENALAIANFEKAIALDHDSVHPSAWPHINLAAALQLLGRLPEAEANLRDAIRLEPGIAPAHFQLGNVLDSMGNPHAAVEEYKQAVRLDSSYAEPHYALARVYRRLGESALAQQEVQIYLRLHNASTSTPISSQPAHP